MATKGLKTVASSVFQFGGQRLLVKLVQKPGQAKPWRVFVCHRDGGRVLASGHTGLDDREEQARELYDWTCDEAKKKGWEPGVKRGGRVRLLPGVPSPATKTQKLEPVPARRAAR